MKFSIDVRRLLLSTSEPQALRLDARPLPAFVKDPPKRVKLLSFGLNKTVYGDLWLTEEGARQCLVYEATLGRDLCWDWCHYTEPGGPPPPSAEAQKAAAWFSLEIVPGDGLYASTPRKLAQQMPGLVDGIHWTEDGARHVCSLEFRHYSPGVLWLEDKQKRKQIVGITSCALTNNPATLNQQPLLCAASTTGFLMNWAQIEAQLRANGATEQQIAEARAHFDGGRQAEALQLSAQIASERAAQLTRDNEATERRLVLSEFSNRFTPAERPTLETLPPATLRQLLSVRPALAIHAPAVQPVPQPAPQQQNLSGGPVITDNNNPLTTNLFGEARPWHHLNYKERASLKLLAADTYRQMRRQAQEINLPVHTVPAEHLGRPVRNLRNMLLATGVTVPGDIVEVVPEVLNDAIEAGIAGQRVFQGSPVVIARGDLPSWNTNTGKQIKGGDTITIPYWETIGDFETVSDETSVPTTIQKLETTEETSTVIHKRLAVQIAYVTSQFAAEGSDPIFESSRQMIEKAFHTMESTLVSKSRDTTLSLDITAVGDGLLTYDAFVKALEKWGDEEFENGQMAAALAFMHSNSLRQVRSVKDANGMPIFTDARNGEPPRVMGIPGRISDLLTTVTSNHVLSLAKAGAMALWFNKSKLMVQNFHDVSTDQDLNVVHLYYAGHLYKRPARKTKCGVVKIVHKAAV